METETLQNRFINKCPEFIVVNMDQKMDTKNKKKVHRESSEEWVEGNEQQLDSTWTEPDRSRSQRPRSSPESELGSLDPDDLQPESEGWEIDERVVE